MVDASAWFRFKNPMNRSGDPSVEVLEARIAALEAARSAPAPKVLYEGEASVLRDGLLLLTPGAMTILSVQKRVHVVVTAAEGDES